MGSENLNVNAIKSQVKSFIDRKVAFGNYTLSKMNLDKKYTCTYEKSKYTETRMGSGDTIYAEEASWRNKKGKTVATASDPGIYGYGPEREIVDKLNNRTYSCSHIKLNNGNYSGGEFDDYDFNAIQFNGYRIEDSNRNGHIDAADRIIVNGKEQKIFEFLGIEIGNTKTEQKQKSSQEKAIYNLKNTVKAYKVKNPEKSPFTVVASYGWNMSQAKTIWRLPDGTTVERYASSAVNDDGSLYYRITINGVTINSDEKLFKEVDKLVPELCDYDYYNYN